MNNQKRLDEFRRALNGAVAYVVSCQECGKEARGWSKPTTETLECPYCHSMDTTKELEVGAKPPDLGQYVALPDGQPDGRLATHRNKLI